MLVYRCGIVGLMSTQQILLSLLDGHPSYGYDLKREYDERFPNLKPLRFSQIYSTLSRLDRDGLVTLVGESGGNGPDRKQYAITESGVSDLETWLSAPLPVDEAPKGELFLKVSLALLSGRDAQPFLEAQRARHMARMREVTSQKRNADSETEIVVCDFTLFHLEADLSWIDHTTERLSRLKVEFKR